MLLTRKIGIAYGGTYGLIMATALEATPRRARGIVAGFTQQGFAAGYMLASGFHLAMSKISFTIPSIICILLKMLHTYIEMAMCELESDWS